MWLESLQERGRGRQEVRMRISLRGHMRVMLALGLALALVAAFAAPKVIQASGVTINDYSPSSGPTRTVIAIHGSDLIFTNGVTIGGVSARWRVHSTSPIDLLAPDAEPSGPIAIMTAMGALKGRTFRQAFRQVSTTLSHHLPLVSRRQQSPPVTVGRALQ
jgi:hypothetical protein